MKEIEISNSMMKLGINWDTNGITIGIKVIPC